jgi:hypothetical protein
MFAIVTHNAIGTVHSLIYGFATVKEAEAYRVRYAYTGVLDCPIIHQDDEKLIRAINSCWSMESRQYYRISDGLRRRYERELDEALASF